MRRSDPASTPSGSPATDAAIRRALMELGDADAAWTPGFDAVLAPRPRRPALRARWTAMALAAGVMVAAAVGYRVTRPQPIVVPQEVIALSSWTPTTDVLLAGARMHLPTQTPRFGASLLDTLRRDFR
jgi:hypothetical protein